MAKGNKVAVPILDGEDPWTDEELDEVREDLDFDVQRMERAIRTSEKRLERLFDDGTEGAGRDPADVGSTNFERDQEMSLVQNARDMLDQTHNALRRLESGQYGWCEFCGQPIGKDRLIAFPRATLCLACKHREERR